MSEGLKFDGISRQISPIRINSQAANIYSKMDSE